MGNLPEIKNLVSCILYLVSCINGVALTALIDSCSSESFINEQVANRLKLTLSPSTRNISMALTTLKTDIIGCCTADITLNNSTYTKVKLSVLKDLCIVMSYSGMTSRNAINV